MFNKKKIEELENKVKLLIKKVDEMSQFYKVNLLRIAKYKFKDVLEYKVVTQWGILDKKSVVKELKTKYGLVHYVFENGDEISESAVVRKCECKPTPKKRTRKKAK